MAHIYDIPDDHIQLIALDLPLQALAQLARTSKRINAAVNDESFWKAKCTREGLTAPSDSSSFKAQYQLFSRQILAFCRVGSKYLRVLQLVGDTEWRQKGPDFELPLCRHQSPGAVCKRTHNTVWLHAEDLAFYEVNVSTMQCHKLDLAVLPSQARRCGSFVIHQDVLYLFGSTDNHRDIFSLDLTDNKATWALFAQSEREIYTCDLQIVGDEIYWKDSGSFGMLHTKTREFRRGSCDRFEQGDVRSCFYKNRLYCAGGMAFGVTAEFDCYDVATDSWQHLPHMLKARISAPVLVHRDRIWVIGGSENMHIQTACESYDVEKKEWRKEARLPKDIHVIHAVLM
eukprot:TRINITY_DN5286_c1_g1_i1.p1 TRINITY_DN5286_c1_g1~~TRINITY_DN5286_c1_g1_i1.p1  ORF type:complete len:354 (-),score=48.07 TRINITY_DN5286_c1_g1_i1:14-1042(-)